MELSRLTIGQILRRNAAQWPEKEAAVFCETNTRFTWKQLDQAVDDAARGFLALGAKRGDHIAMWGTNVAEWLIVQLAAARIGTALVTINPEWKQKELEYALAQSDTNYLVMTRGFVKKLGNKVFNYDYPGMMLDLQPWKSRFPELRAVILAGDPTPDGMIAWQDFLKARVDDQALQQAEAVVDCEDIAMIQYTSGTTGFPKGAMLTHFNVVNNALIATDHLRLQANDRLCIPVPFYHCFGSILGNLGALSRGDTLVVPANAFNAHKTLEAVQQEHCTVLYGVPTMFIAEMDNVDFSHFDIHTLRTGIMAGAPVDKELFEAVTGKMGAREMTIAYGLTEASPVTHQTEVKDPLEKRITTVGHTIEHTEARIVDPNTFRTLPPGQVGEIWVKGFHVMKGYYKKPEETAKAIVEDGWLRTGDLGTADESGFFRIVGRLKEMFIVGGHNVYPAEVEQSLHTLLADKAEIVQVVGVPHPKLQEVAGLIIKCLPGENLSLEEVQQRCEGQLEWPKIPKYLKVVSDFSEFSTVTGKIQKFKLSEALRKEYALEG